MPADAQDAQGRVIWITGLSGAGKTTLAHALLPEIPEAILLDGDELREVLAATTTGFDAASRKSLAFIYARFARLLARQGKTVIVATISLYHDVHAWNRAHLPGYVEIFLDVSEEIRRQRDPKGLYAGERRGTVQHMAGGMTAVEFPEQPHIRLYGDMKLDAMVRSVLQYLKQR